MMKRMIGVFTVVAVLLCVFSSMIAVPASALTVPPDGKVSVATWKDFREALMSSDVTEVYVPEGVTIQHTFGDTEHEEDVRVDVVGDKKLTIDGSVLFTGSINETGLICLWESSDSLTVCGNGSLTYKLRHRQSGDVLYIEEGSLFYLSGGALTVQGDVNLVVQFAWIETNHSFCQSVIGGVRGNVKIEGGILSGHTIFSDGLDWTVSGGIFDCAAQYDYDIKLSSGSMTLSGGAFATGVSYTDNRVSLADGIQWISADGQCYDEVQPNQAGFAWDFGFATQSPAMPSGKTSTDLGTIPQGVSYPLTFSANAWGYQVPSWNLTKDVRLNVYNGDTQLVKTLFADGSLPVEYNLKELPADDYTLVESVVLKKDGTETDRMSHTFHVTISDTAGRLTRAEIYDIQRPAPGHTPDFTCDLQNPPYCTTPVVNWYALDDSGNRSAAMAADDTFEDNTVYRVEIALEAKDGHVLDFYDPASYVLINRADGHFYYPREKDYTAVVLYADYDTADCITELALEGLQYPIPGKISFGEVVVTDDRLEKVPDVEWYYETNPDTAAAGFTALDGRFKSDRRHQAYIDLATVSDEFWFATDNQGNLDITVTVDGIPADFEYATDALLDDGAVNAIEVARTYTRAQEVDGVFVNGNWLQDGLYLQSLGWTPQTEETIDKDEGYAYYEDGVLTLHNFTGGTLSDYNMIDSYRPLTVCLEGASELMSYSNGICSNDTLTLGGDGSVLLRSSGEGIFAMGAVTVENGAWVIEDSVCDGLWLYDSLTVNGGTLDVYGPQCGINGGDYPPVTINGGTLVARAKVDCAIGWCDTQIADGAEVTVGDAADGTGAVQWDGATDFIDYAYVRIAASSGAPVVKGDLNGDGKVNITDAVMLYYHVNGKQLLKDTSGAELTGDGKINIADAVRLYYFVNGKIDAL